MKSKSYHDLVIKDGKFIGEFEELYRQFNDPWMQSEQPNPYSREAGIRHMIEFNIKSVVECGSGLGYYSSHIYQSTGIIPKGIELSNTAVEKAQKKFPQLDFEKYDLTQGMKKFNEYEAVLFSEIMWYILNDLDAILADLKLHFSGKYFIVNQVFYKGTQQYGNEFFTSVEEMIDYIPFTLLATCKATKKEDTTIESSSIFLIQ